MDKEGRKYAQKLYHKIDFLDKCKYGITVLIARSNDDLLKVKKGEYAIAITIKTRSMIRHDIDSFYATDYIMINMKDFNQNYGSKYDYIMSDVPLRSRIYYLTKYRKICSVGDYANLAECVERLNHTIDEINNATPIPNI